MAHMIDESTGAPAIAYAGATPWHKLGRKMGEQERRDVDAAMRLAGLNWEVERIDIRYPIGYPGMTTEQAEARQLITSKIVPDAKGIIRLDTRAYLGTVGSGYTPIQNAEAAAIVDPLVRVHGCTVEVMASLDGGRRAFALLRMPDATTAPIPGDDVRGYLLVSWSHDGSGAVRVILTPIRVVCQNTLSMANAGRHTVAVTVRHTKSAPERLEQAGEIVQRMQEAFGKTGETYAQLAARTMNAKELAEYIEQIIPAPPSVNDAVLQISATIKERRAAIADLIFHGHHVIDGITNARTGVSTAWRAYNAVTEYFDHVRPGEAKSLAARMTAYDSALFGGNAAIKAQALKVLVAV